jgi:hypothetical protein
LAEPHYDSKFSGDVLNKGCIVERLAEAKATLKDPTKSKGSETFAPRVRAVAERLAPSIRPGEIP